MGSTPSKTISEKVETNVIRRFDKTLKSLSNDKSAILKSYETAKRKFKADISRWEKELAIIDTESAKIEKLKKKATALNLQQLTSGQPNPGQTKV